MLRIGCHLPSSKGYLEMGKHAVALGATTFAFFTRNPRGGKAKPIQKEDVAAFLAYAAEHDLQHLVAHAPYTMNLCSADPSIRQFGKDMLADDLQRMEYTPNQYYNFHPGSHVKQGAEVGIAQIAETLNEVLFPEQTTTVLLETMAGKGSEIGRNFEELARIYDGVVYNDKLRVCFDTCHVNDAGYDLVNDLSGVFEKFDKVIGTDQIGVFHINDSKNVLGAGKDRHENIGFGNIGYDTLRQIIYMEQFENIPKILETPYVKDPENSKKSYAPYKFEIEMIKKGEFNNNLQNEILQNGR